MELPRLTFEFPQGASEAETFGREWLCTNGLGSYASGTIALCNTRRYHGVFTPTLPSTGRTVMLPRLVEELSVGGDLYRVDAEERDDGTLVADNLEALRRFELVGTIPEWSFEWPGARLWRSLVFVHGENTAYLSWRNDGTSPVRLRLRPFTAFRFHDRPMPAEPSRPLALDEGERVEVTPAAMAPPLRLRVHGHAAFKADPVTSEVLRYRIEKARGLDHTEVQCSPGFFEADVAPGQALSLAITVEGWERVARKPSEAFAFEQERQRALLARAPAGVREGVGGRLVLAADQFLIKPSSRPSDEAWARATGQHARSVIAGYPWFTDWGRDTMISLEGLTLATGRAEEAAAILRTFRHYVKDGLIPNLFPEGNSDGLYHTADATLWFFHAVNKTVVATKDEALLAELYPALADIVDHHQQGTHYGIHVDPADGLLAEGAEGYQLTWMDAKVDGWVVTPRRGKAVEINALWFNALSLMADWSHRVGADGGKYAAAAIRAKESFNRRFWNEQARCLFDVVDTEGGGNDPSVRPNQVFAMSLEHPVLDRARWPAVLERVERELLTPVGLRTLSPHDPQYKATYDGDLRARDAAYHQGTVWPWLMGHYVDAVRRSGASQQKLESLVAGLVGHLRDAGLGTVSEIFDATAPFHPRGCFAQAWSVAEMLRIWLSLAGKRP